nr:MAG TPA: hypothetical protein [Caudoviricetes sp.]
MRQVGKSKNTQKDDLATVEYAFYNSKSFIIYNIKKQVI